MHNDFNSLMWGDFGNAWFARITLTEGDFWIPGLDDLHLIYGREKGVSYNDQLPAAAVKDGESEVTFTYDLGTGEQHIFARRAVAGFCGAMSEISDDCLIDSDEVGDVATMVGNDPSNLSIQILGDGKFRLAWQYNANEEPAEPDGFKIYSSSDGSDFSTLEATIAYQPGRWRYYWDSDSYSHGTQKWFRVYPYRQFTSELLANNDFNLGDQDWIKAPHWEISGAPPNYYAVMDGEQTSAETIGQESLSIIENEVYKVDYTILEYGAGTLKAKVGGLFGTARSANGVYTEYIKCGSSSVFLFEADTDFEGQVDNASLTHCAERINTNTVTATADAQGPPAISTLTAETS